MACGDDSSQQAPQCRVDHWQH